MMTRQLKIVLACVLPLVLAYAVYQNFWPADPVAPASGAQTKFVPLPVENPALRLDQLEALKKFEYQGTHRNIFDAAPPPPPAPVIAANAGPSVPVAPPPPPALVVPAKLFGYVADLQTGTRRALFSEGDNVYVLGVGEILMGRYRLVQIGNTTAELEETSSGRRATLTMEEPG